jgi:V8-like Glu-specific endopeptidase
VPDEAKPLGTIEPSKVTLPTSAFKQRFDSLSRKAGIADRQHFASGWAQRKQDIYETNFEATIGVANFLPFGVLQLAATNGRAVCKIEAAGINHLGQLGSWVGTGFLVGPEILLTNHHVLNSPDVAESGIAIFNYEANAAGGAAQLREYTLAPNKLFITSPAVDGLDYTFVAVTDKPEQEFGIIDMYRGAFATDFMKRANVIQHPDGRPKEVVLQDNRVLPDDHPLFLHYTTDTEGGTSGSPVFDNNWQLKALHHASRKNIEQVRPEDTYGPPPKRLNEGVKIAAIAADLELRLEDSSESAAASRVLELFRGVDSNTGFFGVRGRRISNDSPHNLEAVIETYYGKEQDIDIAFWNVEWFNRNYHEHMKDVAGVIADQNIDIWAFSETSPEATEALVAHMWSEFGQMFEWAASEPNASSSKQTTTVMWNAKTVTGSRHEWPDEIADAFRSHSRDIASIDFEAVEGKIFDRYPGLFYFSSLSVSEFANSSFDFYLVPLHLKAKDEGSKRRRMASELLAKAISVMVKEGCDQDWVLGGDFNADLASGDLDPLQIEGFAALSARDEAMGAFSYLSQRYRSLIDHIFLSPDMTANNDDGNFFILANDKKYANFADDISDHRPVVARLSLNMERRQSRDDAVAELVDRYRDRPAELLRMIADEIERRTTSGND